MTFEQEHSKKDTYWTFEQGVRRLGHLQGQLVLKVMQESWGHKDIQALRNHKTANVIVEKANQRLLKFVKENIRALRGVLTLKAMEEGEQDKVNWTLKNRKTTNANS